MSSISKWWMGVGLQLRLQVLIQGFLVVALVVAQHWLMRQLEQHELKTAQERTSAIADGVLNGLNTLMSIKVEGHDVISDAPNRALFIQRLGISDKLLELRVVRAKSVNDEFGAGLPQENPVDELDHEVLATGKPQFRTKVDSNGVASIRAVLPSIARTEFRQSKCTKCHSAEEGAVLGLVSITMDVTDDLADMASVNFGLWIGQILLQCLLFFVIGYIVRRSLQQLGAEPEDAARLAQSVARGDLRQPIPLKPGDTESMMAQLKNMQDSLASVVSNVRRGAEGVAAASAEIAQGNGDLSVRTERQACALGQTTASLQNLDAMVRQNAANANKADQLAIHASEVATRGGDVVSDVVTTMLGINQSSQKISDIISVIDGIAFQTNILALNAAVEAARAGEQGRGFAVVATEVRSLAGRSAQAAREIKALIDASVEQVERGTVLVDKAGSTMLDVVESIQRVTEIMGEISHASDAQSQAVAEVLEAIQQMDGVTQQNAALVEEVSASANSLESQSRDLVQTVAVFKLD